MDQYTKLVIDKVQQRSVDYGPGLGGSTMFMGLKQ